MDKVQEAQEATNNALSRSGRQVDAISHVLQEHPKLMVSVSEVTGIVGLGRTTVLAEIAAGRIASVKVGRRRLIPMASLEAYVAGLQSGAA